MVIVPTLQGAFSLIEIRSNKLFALFCMVAKTYSEEANWINYGLQTPKDSVKTILNITNSFFMMFTLKDDRRATITCLRNSRTARAEQLRDCLEPSELHRLRRDMQVNHKILPQKETI